VLTVCAVPYFPFPFVWTFPPAKSHSLARHGEKQPLSSLGKSNHFPHWGKATTFPTGETMKEDALYRLVQRDALSRLVKSGALSVLFHKSGKCIPLHESGKCKCIPFHPFSRVGKVHPFSRVGKVHPFSRVGKVHPLSIFPAAAIELRSRYVQSRRLCTESPVCRIDTSFYVSTPCSFCRTPRPFFVPLDRSPYPPAHSPYPICIFRTPVNSYGTASKRHYAVTTLTNRDSEVPFTSCGYHCHSITLTYLLSLTPLQCHPESQWVQ
jgi:hypothetical protein